MRHCLKRGIAMRYMILAALSVFAAACSSNPAVEPVKVRETEETVAQRGFLIGRFLGEAPTTDGSYRYWIVDRKADGTFRIDFRNILASGVPQMHSEVGIWGNSGGIYFTATRGFAEGTQVYPADTTDPSLYDTYRIVGVTADGFEYENLSTGNVFKVRRIGADESFPR